MLILPQISANAYLGATTPTNPVVASLESTNASPFGYLQQSNANWGSYTRSKFAIAGSIKLDTWSGGFLSKGAGSTAADYEFRIDFDTGGIRFRGTDSGGTPWQIRIDSGFSTGTWYAYLLHYDGANATADSRLRLWVNNSEITSFTIRNNPANVTTQTTTSDVLFFKDNTSGSFTDGLGYSQAFFDNALPDPSVIFDGSAGKLLDLSGITGLKSLLTGSSATDDFLLADWTNVNSGITTSATVP